MKVAVFGAGLVGLFVGGSLLKAKHEVVFFGRERYGKLISQFGLTLSKLSGESIYFKPDEIKYHTDTKVLVEEEFDFVLVTLKAVQNSDAIQILQASKHQHKIVSLQNGVHNAEQLQEGLPNHKVISGMFPFSVVFAPDCHFRQASMEKIYLDDVVDARPIADALTKSGVATTLHSNMTGILYGKLLINLNNAVNALSGLDIGTQLGQLGYRRLFALCLQEAFKVFEAQGIVPIATVMPVPFWLFAKALPLPNFMFNILIARTSNFRGNLISSMLDDLRNKRKTEIDQLQGEIIKLGHQHNIPTPYNEALLKLVRQAEEAQAGSPKMSPEQIKAAIAAQTKSH